MTTTQNRSDAPTDKPAFENGKGLSNYPPRTRTKTITTRLTMHYGIVDVEFEISETIEIGDMRQQTAAFDLQLSQLNFQHDEFARRWLLKISTDRGMPANEKNIQK